MPPKKKGTSKDPDKTAKTINGLPMEEVSNMSQEQLEELVVRLREQQDRQRERTNYCRLERERICACQEITDRELEETRAELKNLVMQWEEDERRHRGDTMAYKQMMKELVHEHQKTIAELNASGLVSTEAVLKEQEQLGVGLCEKMRVLFVDMEEEKLGHENIVKELKLKHEEEMTTERNILESKLAEIRAKNKEELELLQQELENLRKVVIRDRNHQGFSHVTALKENHSVSFREAVELDRDLLEPDILIESDAEPPPPSKEEEVLEARISKIKEDIAGVEEKIEWYSQKRDVGYKAKNRELKQRKEEYEALKQKASEFELKRDELCKTHAQNMQKVQQEGDVMCKLLEKNLQDLTDSVEKTQAQLSSALSAPNVDPTALTAITNKYLELLESRNIEIKNLESRKKEILQTCRNLQMTIEAKKSALGGPVERRLAGESAAELLGFAPK